MAALVQPPGIDPVQRGLRVGTVKQPTKARTGVPGETQKRGRCGSAYRDVVGVCSDPVGAERHHDVRSLLPEHFGDH
jgi:hypothetical protein